jgi:hypothetical protein
MSDISVNRTRYNWPEHSPLRHRAERDGTNQPLNKFSVRVRIGQGEVEKTLFGRFAWTVIELINAGERGLTAADLPPGLRLAHYIFRLKRDGIPIRAERERHGGRFSGSHARYRLAGPIEIVGD